MSGKESKSAIGRGIDNLIPLSSEETNEADIKSARKREVKETPTSTIPITKDVFIRALEDGKKNPRVVVWSPKASVVLRVLRKTIPEFSISNEASELLEEAIKRKYPEIWEKVEALLEEE